MVKKFIQCDPAIMMGKPVIAGTRITVELILEKLAAGETIEYLKTFLFNGNYFVEKSSDY